MSDFHGELKAKFTVSGVLVYKDKDGNVVGEVPFSVFQDDLLSTAKRVGTELMTEMKNGDQRSE